MRLGRSGGETTAVKRSRLVTFTFAGQTNANNVTLPFHACSLRKHLKTHSGEKSNKCNQCYFAYSNADNLRKH